MTGRAGQTRRPAKKQNSRMGLLGAGILVAFVAAGIALVVTDEPAPEKTEVAPVEVSGEVLPPQPDQATASDPAVGMAAPQASGVNFDDEPVDLLNDEGGTVIVFLAHWCSHCRAEVPVLVDQFPPDSLPENVRMVGVSTGVTSTQPNYPPSAWLEREEWPYPVLVDSAEGEVAGAYGLGGTPLFVVVGPEGDVRFRASGELAPQQIQQLIDLAAEA